MCEKAYAEGYRRGFRDGQRQTRESVRRALQDYFEHVKDQADSGGPSMRPDDVKDLERTLELLDG